MASRPRLSMPSSVTMRPTWVLTAGADRYRSWAIRMLDRTRATPLGDLVLAVAEPGQPIRGDVPSSAGHVEQTAIRGTSGEVIRDPAAASYSRRAPRTRQDLRTGTRIVSTSSADQHRDVIHRWVASFNAHDAVGVAALYGQDACVVHPAYRQPLRGRKPVQDDTRAYMVALPNVSAELNRVVVDQDCAAAQVTVRGVHAGLLVLATGTRPPTGRPLEFTVALFCRFGPEGEIVEEHRYYDVDDIRGQLGDAEHRR